MVAEGPDADRGGAGPSEDPRIGTTVSHYRIDGILGRGGMGVVYRASDLRLERTVALKFLPPFMQDDPNARERFTAEARAASALDHPNICTIHEIAEDETGRTYIAMACYEGETLKEKLADGALPVDEALDYAVQMAAGLAKAHQNGIIHRDIKPANVIVTDDGIVKILDFGLAKVEDQQLTRTGESIGTLEYMSPEQIQCDPVDAPSDVWSLGALVFELLTGTRPFRGDNYAAVLYAVVHGDPPDPKSLNADIPETAASIVLRCLAKEQDERYADAGELHAALVDEVAVEAGGGLGVKGVVGGALAVAAAVALLLVIPPTRDAILSVITPSPATAENYVAVIPSSGGGEEDQLLAEGLTHSLTWELSNLSTGEASIVVLPAGEVLNLDRRTAQRVHELYNVNRIVMVAINRIGVENVTVELVDPANQLQQIARIELPLPNDARFQDSVPRALAALMGVSTVIARERPEAPSTDADAYTYYTLARGYRARYDDLDNLDYAVDLFEQALAIDAGYAPAHAGLCETRFEQFRLSLDTMFVNQARPSCDEALRLGGDLPEVMVPVAAVYLQTGAEGRALAALNDVIAADSSNADAHRWIGRVWEELGDRAQAIAAYETAIRLNPRMWVYHSELGGLLLYLGQLDEAASRYRQIRRLAPDNYFGDMGLSAMHMLNGQPDEAERILTPLLEDPGHPRIISNMGYVHLLRGDYAAAIEVLEEGLDTFDRDIFIWRWLADARHWAGDREGAREAWDRIIELATPLLAISTSSDDGMAVLAEAYAQLGDPTRARQYLALLAADSGVWPYNIYFMGRTYEMLGDRPNALRWVEEALRDGWSLENMEWDPWLADLRTDPEWPRIVSRAAGG